MPLNYQLRMPKTMLMWIDDVSMMMMMMMMMIMEEDLDYPFERVEPTRIL